MATTTPPTQPARVVVAPTAADPTVEQAAATTPTPPTLAVTPAPTTTPLVVTPVPSTAAVSAPPTNPPPDIVTAPSAAGAQVTATAPPTAQPAPPPQGGDATALLTAPEADTFIRSYYDSVAAGDYATSWAQLAPEFQRGKARSYEYYVGFWDDNDIEVDDVVLIDADAGQATVHVQLRWNGSPTAVTDAFTIRAGELGEPLIAGQRTIDDG